MVCLSYARHILGLPKHSSTALAWSLSGLLTTAGVNARERERLRLQLTHTAYPEAIAARLLRALEAEPITKSSVRGVGANWAHVTAVLRRAELANGALLGEPQCCNDIPRVCHVYGRSVSYCEVKRLSDKATGAVSAVAGAPLLPSFQLPPPSRGSAVHDRTLRFDYWAPSAVLGQFHGHTPISISGPCCSGSLLALADKGRFRAVESTQLGSEALHDWPFTQPPQFQPAPGCSKAQAKAAAKQFYTAVESEVPCKARLASTSCTPCGLSEQSYFHLACECHHPAMWHCRRETQQSAASLLRHLWRAGTALLEAEGIDTLWFEKQPIGALQPLLSAGPDVSDHDGQAITYWMLMATPWPEAAASSQMPLAAALGALFDSLNARHHQLREWAHCWLYWSESRLRSLALAHRLALGEIGPLPQATPATAFPWLRHQPSARAAD